MTPLFFLLPELGFISSGNTLPQPMMWLLDASFKKFHANNHVPLSNDANLALIQKQLQENKSVIMLISPQLNHKIKIMRFSKPYVDANVNAIFTRKTSDDSLLGFSIDHYVNLHKLEIVDDSTVNLEYTTYGKKHSATITRAEVLAGFRGAILATSPLY